MDSSKEEILRKNTLFLIPARGGSKGLPGKNIKLLNGKPLISYSIDFARKFVDDSNICLSTDDKEILEVAKKEGLSIPFVRPNELASDTANTFDVIKHALFYYKELNKYFQYIVLLQPTSPFREEIHLLNGFEKIGNNVDAVVSVFETKSNPYYVLFEEIDDVLVKSKSSDISRRQELPKVYELNGSIYILNVKSIEKYSSISKFERIVKNVMPFYYSVDIDNLVDWKYCEFILENNLLNSK